MKPISVACHRLTRTSPADWKRADLEPLTGPELELLARLLGIPYTGTKTFLADRLIDAAALRDLLSIYPADHEGAALLAGHFKRKELVDMARRAKSFYCVPKIGVAVGLLNWREACRRQGKAFLKEWQEASKEAAKSQPRQLRFKFDT